MGEDAHKEQGQAQTFEESPDRVLLDLIQTAWTNHAMNNPVTEFASDLFFSAKQALLGFTGEDKLHFGNVVYALPYANGYKVQLDQFSSARWCCMGSETSLVPMGVRSSSPISPGSRVVVWLPPKNDYGVILGTIPSVMYDPNLTVPDWLCQGGGTGINREKCYIFPYKNLDQEGGILDFSEGRPIDATVMEWGRVSDTGIAIMIDAFQAFLRVNEMCGIFLNYFDSHCKLAGVNMDIVSAVHELVTRDDEGELQLFRGIATYPWEAAGAFNTGEELWEEKDDNDVQFDKHVGKLDFTDAEPDIQPYYRYQEYGGYLGQGYRRLVISPAEKQGKHLYSGDPKQDVDMGVFAEGIGLDGSYWVQSAKGIFITKRTLIPVPKQQRLPEDQKEGDDKEKDNYKFSGQFGGGDDHKVGDIEIEGDLQHLLQVAGIFDVVTYHTNWKALHPFHYHKEDYTVPEESDYDSLSGGPTRTQDVVDFTQLRTQTYLDYPSPQQVRIDDRYEFVDYFQREAGIALLPDGGICLYDGYGAQVTLSAGSIRFDCPGDVQLMPGRNLVALGGSDIVLRAHDSVDVTAGKKDLRLKAEKNLHMLGGNSGDGAVLIESKSKKKVGASQFENIVGEDVVSHGIILRAPDSELVTWCGDVYIRSTSGPVTLDSNKSGANIVLKANELEAYLSNQFEIYLGPSGEGSNVSAAFAFDSAGLHVANQLEVLSQIVCRAILTTGPVLSIGPFLSNSHPEVLDLGPAAASITAAIQRAEQKQQELRSTGSAEHTAIFPSGFYEGSSGSGRDKLIDEGKFSYRDDEGKQYNTQDFKLIESRWHTMVRLNLGTGGIDWVEPTVDSPKGKQLPWPGKKNWEDSPTLQQLKELTMYDAANGRAQDRGEDGGPYTEPKLGTLEPVAPKSGFKVIGE